MSEVFTFVYATRLISKVTLWEGRDRAAIKEKIEPMLL